jgi:hypothetical protein
MLSHGTWFKGTPRRDVLESIFIPWVPFTMNGNLQFTCDPPTMDTPGGAGSGAWLLNAIKMSKEGIKPVWRLVDFTPDTEDDKISLFGDARSVNSSDEREINFEDLPKSTATGPVTKIRDRTWDTRRMAAKDRVREAFLKVRIAEAMAHKEETRFISMFGELKDDESHFSSDFGDDTDDEVDSTNT